MRLVAALLTVVLLVSLVTAYKIKQSRDEMLDYYYAYVDDKVPKSARMLVGDEKVNVYIADQPLGIEIRRGQLYSFETYPIDKATTTIMVSEEAAEKISSKKMGIMQGIESGGIKIETNNLLSAIKIEAIKRIYAVSGADDKILGKTKGSSTAAALASNSIYFVRKTRIAG